MMNSNLPPHPSVLFSYSSEDRALVMRLESDLQSYRVNAWTGENLRAGVNSREQTEKAIQAAETSNETSPLEIHEADFDKVMAIFEELEPYYSKTNQILADL